MKSLLHNSKGYFFTLDAVIAIIILTIGIVIILVSVSNTPVETPQFFLADDILTLLAVTDDTSVTPPQTYYNRIGEVYFNYKTLHGNFDSTASGMIELNQQLLNKEIVPRQFNLRLRLEDGKESHILYTIAHGVITADESDNLITARKIIIAEDGHWGPYVVEAQVWR